MIHDNKSEDTYTKNDVDRKSFIPIYAEPSFGSYH